MNDVCLIGEGTQNFMDNFECKPNVIEFSRLPDKENPFVILDMNLEDSKYAQDEISLLRWNVSNFVGGDYHFAGQCFGKSYRQNKLCSTEEMHEARSLFDDYHPNNHYYSHTAIKGICKIQNDIIEQFQTLFPHKSYYVYSYIRTENDEYHDIIKDVFASIKSILGYKKVVYNTDDANPWHIDYADDTTVDKEPNSYRTTLLLKGNSGTYFYKDTYCQANGEQILSNVKNGIPVEENDISYAKIGQLGLFRDHCAIHSSPNDQKERLLLFMNFNELGC